MNPYASWFMNNLNSGNFNNVTPSPFVAGAPVASYQPLKQTSAYITNPDRSTTVYPTVTHSTTTTPTGGGGGGASQPSEPAPSGPSPDELFRQEIDNVSNPIFDYLNQAESNIRGDYPSVLDEINAAIDLARQNVGTQESQSIATAEREGQKAQTRAKDSTNAQRNLLNELLRGGMQRFGGASSAGDAFQALSSREFQRNVGGIQRGLNETMGDISQNIINIRENAANSIKQLDLELINRKNEARREFENKILEINRLRSETESNKAQMRLQALQDLRNQTFQLELQNNELKNNIALAAQNASGISDTFGLYGQGQSQAAASTSGAYNPTLNPTTDLTFGGGQEMGSLPMTGNIRRDEQTGYVMNPLRKDYLYPVGGYPF